MMDAAAPQVESSSPRRKRRAWPWLIALACMVLVVTAFVRRSGGASKDIDASLIVKVKRGDLAIEVIETGKVQPREKVEVKSKVAGQVERVFVEEGDRVKRGQLLLKLDPTDYLRDRARAAADVGRAMADLAATKNALAFARLNLDRRKRGLETRGVAQADVDFAESDLKAKIVAVKMSQVALSGARVALAAASDRLRYTRIDSPMNGTVIERGIQPGEVVTPGVQATFEGKALLTVADLSTLLVKADLNQIDVAKVRLGQDVTLSLDALPGKKYQAKVTKVAPASTLPKGKDVDVFPIEATLAKADGQIKPGMTAEVRVHIETRKNVLSLPIEAVAKEAGKLFVTRVLDGAAPSGLGARMGLAPAHAQRTEKVEITVGAKNDRELEVLSGVSEGDPVVIKPASSAENEYK